MIRGQVKRHLLDNPPVLFGYPHQDTNDILRLGAADGCRYAPLPTMSGLIGHECE